MIKHTVIYLVSITVILFAAISTNAQITVMSFNIRYNNPHDHENKWELRKGEVAGLIKKNNPDIIGIQEGLHDQITFLDSTLSSYSYTGVGRDDGKQKGEYAAIFFNHEKETLLESNTYWLSETPDTVSVGWDASMERIVTFAVFKDITTNDTLYVFNCHYDHIGNVARKKSSELILELISNKKLQNKKVILTGDFNSTMDDEPIQILKTDMLDSFDYETTHTDTTGTFNGFNPEYKEKKRIDYIFIKNMDVSNYRIVTDKRENGLYISDHFPVMIAVY